jgi:hypothetical protein
MRQSCWKKRLYSGSSPKTWGQKSLEHRDMRGKGVSAHRPAATRPGESVEHRRVRFDVGVVAAGIPGDEKEIFLLAERLKLPKAEWKQTHRSNPEQMHHI